MRGCKHSLAVVEPVTQGVEGGPPGVRDTDRTAAIGFGRIRLVGPTDGAEPRTIRPSERRVGQR